MKDPVPPPRLALRLLDLFSGWEDDYGAAWRQTFPLYPVEYRFFDEDFDQMYRKDERMGTILKVFSTMAILIACLGLFGLASYTAEQRTKEIGVRKIMGATSPGIVLLLSKEFAKWVLAANVLALTFALRCLTISAVFFILSLLKKRP